MCRFSGSSCVFTDMWDRVWANRRWAPRVRWLVEKGDRGGLSTDSRKFVLCNQHLDIVGVVCAITRIHVQPLFQQEYQQVHQSHLQALCQLKVLEHLLNCALSIYRCTLLPNTKNCINSTPSVPQYMPSICQNIDVSRHVLVYRYIHFWTNGSQVFWNRGSTE